MNPWIHSYKKTQLDFHIRLWDYTTGIVCTRYFTSQYLGRTASVDLIQGFRKLSICLELMIQVGMDGPNVNLLTYQHIDPYRSTWKRCMEKDYWMWVLVDSINSIMHLRAYLLLHQHLARSSRLWLEHGTFPYSTWCLVHRLSCTAGRLWIDKWRHYCCVP